MSNDIQTITSKLWAMANELRGTMDASEYKNYILAFMFYRYLSEHQEQYLVGNNVIDVEEGQSINDAYKEQAVDEELNDYLEDISASLGYAIAPNDTWESLVNKINDSQVIPSDYQTIFDNFNKNAELNKEAAKDFRGVFNDINLGDSRLGNSTNERAKSLNNIVKLVDEIEYKGDDGKDILGEIYEYLIGQFAANAGKKGGEFYTPHQVSKILAKIVTSDVKKLDEFFNIYDPTMGSGSLLLTVGQELPKGTPMKYFGQELNTTTYNLARMNLMMHNVSYNNMILNNADTLESDWPDGPDEKGIDRPRSFDAVVANPPYSAKWDNDETKLKDPRFSDYGKLAPASKADYAFILHSIYHLNNDGTMAIVLPHGVLFRGAAEGKIRQTLIEKNYLDAVIGLPANLFYGTSIPTIILVLKKNRKNKDILFIDASNDFEKCKNQNNLTDENVDKIISTFKERKDIDKYAHVASIEEIRENDFNLNIPRYVDTFEEEEPIDLEEVNRQLEQDNKEIAELEAEINEQLKILGVKL
ncbi:type I restriction-modification system subunit M [Clostridium butyricum]|uniref:site-specific DNA-methyltransferase (adenine-specific) n=3 Tax=Clostridium butyricum TaxID=1492 RepID=A0A6M0UEZ6_CLOBU|nr:type I restriction-modification system subunit M [Clostridium butyricum]ETI87969.1 MAG: Type I restriction-modification system, M subunit [Clostridium butyricum DORA_1]MBO1687127.1 type I restriction-modification system subunit M [Clostridium butyricum]MCQ2017650.1 type I restriction-modification system subunit M [Clostridium butyricum]MCQ2022646.1 type I restriction-modification system subunit M [Clostridium butyricum]MCQ2027546.1 type I restriction-modification system subunit M [Clostridi